MSNRLKLARTALPHCGSCGKAVPQAMTRQNLRDGRIICARCIDRGVLFQRLACGHYGVAGRLVAGDSADFRNMVCADCYRKNNPA